MTIKKCKPILNIPSSRTQRKLDHYLSVTRYIVKRATLISKELLKLHYYIALIFISIELSRKKNARFSLFSSIIIGNNKVDGWIVIIQ